jgi:hypothetical protein
MPPTYMSGTLVSTKAAFVDKTGAAADPTTITLKYKQGAAATVTVVYPSAPIVRDGQGGYHADLPTDGWAGPGNRLDIQQWAGTGNVQAIEADTWEVEPPAL